MDSYSRSLFPYNLFLLLLLYLEEESSSKMTLTGQNRTDLLDFSLDDGVLLKQDLENDDAEEHVVVDDAVAATVAEVTVVLILLSFLVFPAPVNMELRKVARRPPGEMGCLTFFKSL